MPVSISRYKNFQRRTHVYEELFVEHVLCISSWKKKTPSSPNIIFYYITAPRLNKKYIAPGHQNLAEEFCVVGGEFSDLRCLMNTLPVNNIKPYNNLHRYLCICIYTMACNLEWRHKSFSFIAARTWNSLPPFLREAENLLTFKRLLNDYYK